MRVPECGLYPAGLLVFLQVSRLGGRGMGGGGKYFLVSSLMFGKRIVAFFFPLGNVQKPQSPSWGPLWPFRAPPSDGQGAPLSQLASSWPPNVASVNICDSCFTPGESFTPVRGHRANYRVITGLLPGHWSEAGLACPGGLITPFLIGRMFWVFLWWWVGGIISPSHWHAAVS